MRWVRAILGTALLTLTVGCQQKMAEQPSFRKYEPSDVFPDGTSARPLPEGAFAREWERDNDPLTTGLRPEARRAKPVAVKAAGEGSAAAATVEPAAPDDPGKFVDTFPFDMTREDLRRGQERYTIFCTACHGPLGDGNGKVVERGYLRPPNYHTDESRGFARFGKHVPLRDAPVGYFFEVVTRGYGAMPRYAPQIPAADRWRIIAYIRALQLSQNADLGKLPERTRRAAQDVLGGEP